MAAIHRQRVALHAADRFELPLVLLGHGWVSLPPHRWSGGDAPLVTTLRLGTQVATARVRQRAGQLAVELQTSRKLSGPQRDEARRQLRHMLRLDDDLTEFWARCAAHPRLGWVARRGGGRLLRSPTVFEDLLKLLFTTNCSWSLTTAMTRNLVAACGAVDPSGVKAFPTAVDCDRGERFFRDVVRSGYRARAAAELAAGFANGDLDDSHFADRDVPTAELRDKLLRLHGIGPYAAGQALRLLGRYDDLALDSWCRARLAEILGKRKAPSDRSIARRYRRFEQWAGLALWCDLTAAWHGEDGAVPTATPANAVW